MNKRFSGKVAIITGAGQGIGASHALAFGTEGADVVVADIDKDQMEKTTEKMRGLGQKAMGITCDVSKAQDVENMIKNVVKEFGRIDILVNNAGAGYESKPIWEVSENEWDVTVNVMFKGTFLCCKHVLPHMIRQKFGKIVNTGSIAARAQKHSAHYSAAKAAIHAFTLATAKDVGEHGINVNCVAPGAVYTPMLEKALQDQGEKAVSITEGYTALCQSFHILGKEILPEDISNTVLFLCSDQARNITGSVIYVDGGFLSI